MSSETKLILYMYAMYVHPWNTKCAEPQFDQNLAWLELAQLGW